MAITYTRAESDWQDGSGGGTSIDAADLDTIEAGIKALYDLVNAKGDLIVATAADTLERLAVGADDTVPTAASGQTTGVIWQKIDNAMVASNAALDYSKLALTDSIVNADINSAAAIAQSKLAFAAWGTYTPVLTATTSNPTLGAGSVQEGRFIQLGDLVIGTAVIQFGTSGTDAGSGIYEVSLPVAARSTTNQYSVGSGNVTEAGVDNDLVNPIVDSSSGDSACIMVVEGANVVSDAIPQAWGAQDRISLSLFYEGA